MRCDSADMTVAGKKSLRARVQRMGVATSRLTFHQERDEGEYQRDALMGPPSGLSSTPHRPTRRYTDVSKSKEVQ